MLERIYLKGEISLPPLLLAIEIMHARIDALKSHLKVEKMPFRGRVVLGIVEGDPHDAGKNIVKAMLEAKGFEVL